MPLGEGTERKEADEDRKRERECEEEMAVDCAK